MHVCPMVTVLVPHVGGPIVFPGAPTVLIGNLPAARITDMCVCVGPPDVIVRGSAGVYIMGLNAARIGDNTAHGGVIVQGWPTVIIGEVGVVSPSLPSIPAMALTIPDIPAIPALPAPPEIPAVQSDLLVDVAQAALDIAGIVDPTPLSDGASAIISIARGDGLSAAISVASILVPYAGDLTKLGKLPKMARTVEKAVAAVKAAPDSAFAKRVQPSLNALNNALKKLPTDHLPQPAKDAVVKIRKSLDEAFRGPNGIRFGANGEEILSADRAMHILDGERNAAGKIKSGGHRHGTGVPGKHEFPPDWADGKILDSVAEIAQTGKITGEAHRAGEVIKSGVIDKVQIEVIVKNDGSVRTAYPIGGPGVIQNPK
jgi:uncharacterized Zn-binding protein involved in type VI secretion